MTISSIGTIGGLQSIPVMRYKRRKRNSNSIENVYAIYLEDRSAGDEKVTLVVDEQNLVVVVCGRCLECRRRSGAVTARTATERRRTVATAVILNWPYTPVSVILSMSRQACWWGQEITRPRPRNSCEVEAKNYEDEAKAEPKRWSTNLN